MGPICGHCGKQAGLRIQRFKIQKTVEQTYTCTGSKPKIFEAWALRIAERCNPTRTLCIIRKAASGTLSTHVLRIRVRHRHAHLGGLVPNRFLGVAHDARHCGLKVDLRQINSAGRLAIVFEPN